MKANELRKSSLEELQKQLMELLREQFNLRMQRGTGQLSKPSQMKAGAPGYRPDQDGHG